MAGRLAEFDIALDDGLEDQFLEVAFDLLENLVGKSESRIIHCEEESFYFECGIEFRLDDFNGVEQFANSFECEVFALNRNDDGIGCSK